MTTNEKNNGKTYTDNYEHTFTTKTDKNGRTLYYIDGERRSHADYMYQFEQRQGLIDELPDKRMRWLNKPEDIYEDATTLESVSGLEGDEHINAKVAERYVKIEGATVQSVEETAPEVNPDEYIITQEAFDEAVEAEELEALFAKWTAETLSDPRIEAAYRKARERVEVEFTSYGAPLYTYIKKNGERCYDERVAKCYIGKCGLSETDFIVKARAEETVCDLTVELSKVTRGASDMTLTTQDGEEFISRFGNVRVQPDGDGFIFTNGHETLARFDTKEQCEFVIDWIKKTVADGGNEFEFPTAELAALEMHAYELLLRYLKANYRYIGRHYWQMRIGDKWRNAPRRFIAADLKYYGLTPAQLKEAYHAAD